MIDQEKLAEIRVLMAGGEPVRPSLSDLSEKELRKLRSDVDQLLPRGGLDGLNLEDELVAQYHKTKDLMDELGEETPANQRAQVCNAVVTALGQLVKLQEDLKRQVKLALMESVLIDAIKTLPETAKGEFFSEYERMAKKAGLM